MQTNERLPLPQLILLLAGMAILLILLLHAATIPPVGINRNNAYWLQQVQRLGDGQVFTAAWSPDGRTIVLGGSVGIWIRDAANLTAPPRLLEGHTGTVLDVAFNPAGTLLASGAEDGTVRLWDTQTWQITGVLEGHPDGVSHVLFSPDDRYLVTTANSHTAPTLRLWDTTNWLPVNVIELIEPVTSMAFSPDSRYLAFTAEDNIYLLDTSTGEWNTLLERTNPLSNRLRTAFSDSGLLAVGDFHRLTGVWSVEDGRADRAASDSEQFDAGLRAYFGAVDGNTLTYDRQPVDPLTAQAWSALERRGSSHYDRGVISPAPDGQYVILERYDGWELWNLNTLERIAPLHEPNVWLHEVSILRGNSGVVASSFDMIHVWRFADGQQITLDLRQSGGSVQQLLSHDDPPFGVFTSWTGGLRLVDLTTGTARHSLENITSPASVHEDYVLTYDERTIALNRQDSSTIIWDLHTGSVVSQLARNDPEQRYRPLAFSPDAKLLAADIQDQDCRCRVVSLWDVATGQPVSTLGDTGRTGWTAVFSPDGSQLIAAGGSASNFIRIWNIETGEEIGTFSGPRYNIHNLAITPDGRYVAGSSRTEVWLWDIQAQAALVRLSDDERDYLSAAFNPLGDLLAVGTTRGEILLFDVATGEQIARLQQHKGRVQDIAFSADGQMIASTGGDGTVRLWRTDRVSPMRAESDEPVVLPTVAITPTPMPAA